MLIKQTMPRSEFDALTRFKSHRTVTANKQQSDMSYQDLGNVIALPLKKVWSQAPKKNAELKTPSLSQKTSRQLVCHSQTSCENTQRICTSSNLQLNLTKPAMRIVVPSV